MKTKIISKLGFGMLLLMAQHATAESKPAYCMAIAGYGSMTGVRIYENDDRSITATIDNVDIYHNAITYVDPVPLKIIELKKVHLFGGIIIYSNKVSTDQDQFSFHPFENDEGFLKYKAGDVNFEIDGKKTNAYLIYVKDFNSGYCK